MLEKLTHGVKQLGLELSPRQIHQFQLYYEELMDWNKRINLTSITNYEDVQLKHFLDSLTIVIALENVSWSKDNFSLLDIGTGAGLPGIPIKIIHPEIQLVLIESVAKKTSFLQHIIAKLELDQVKVLTGRAEDLAHHSDYREKFDLVVSRALSKLPTLAELTLPFCRKGGLFIAYKKGAIEEELNQSIKAIDLLGGRLKEIKVIDMELLDRRSLVMVEKISSTPPNYPRRAGIPEKRPL